MKQTRTFCMNTYSEEFRLIQRDHLAHKPSHLSILYIGHKTNMCIEHMQRTETGGGGGEREMGNNRGKIVLERKKTKKTKKQSL